MTDFPPTVGTSTGRTFVRIATDLTPWHVHPQIGVSSVFAFIQAAIVRQSKPFRALRRPHRTKGELRTLCRVDEGTIKVGIGQRWL